MGIHSVSVIPFHLEPFPSPHPREKPQILPGLWLEQMTDTFGTIARQIPPDPTIMDINMVMVLDYPEYTQGLLGRLSDTVRSPAILKELSERHQDMADGYDQHPLEIDIQEEDIRKLLIVSCIIAGAAALVVNRPVLAELTEDSGQKTLKFDGADNFRHVWQLPHKLQEKVTFDDRLDINAVSKYCGIIERYFQPVHWHSGRMAVAIGTFLAYVLGSDDGQRYLALMTIFEALLSTGGSEITHQISERVAFMLESTEDARLALYKRMKKLYKTRSLLVHGAIDNKHGVITYDDLRLDARMTIVPDQDLADIFELVTRFSAAS